jgi:excisionase family DNA binding protein
VSYTLGQAAKSVGRSKPTLAKAIKTGRLSAVRADDGSYRIDPAELHRVYPITGEPAGTMQRSDTPPVETAIPGELEGLRNLLTERDRLVAEQASEIRDLRARLDASEAERRATQVQLTAILTDQRAIPARRWWHWRHS